MLAWTVGVSLVLMLLLIWSALYRDSLRSRNDRAERGPAQLELQTADSSPEPVALPDGSPDTEGSYAGQAAKQAAGK